MTMLSKEKLDRINELSKLSKTVGLTKKQAMEQKALRNEYMSAFRSSFTDHLHTVKVVDAKGNDVTPQKLKDSKAQKHKRLH